MFVLVMLVVLMIVVITTVGMIVVSNHSSDNNSSGDFLRLFWISEMILHMVMDLPAKSVRPTSAQQCIGQWY